MTYNSQILAGTLKHKQVEIHLIRGKSADGIQTYIYLAIYTHRVRDLKLSLMRNATTDLEKYGVILKSGLGEPDEEIKRAILKEYLVNPIES